MLGLWNKWKRIKRANIIYVTCFRFHDDLSFITKITLLLLWGHGGGTQPESELETDPSRLGGTSIMGSWALVPHRPL